ncbi:MAG: ribonuclease Y [Patescibacteria group bacterium]|nr:ribonuclease Y [Patescibacteria group bacterium]
MNDILPLILALALPVGFVIGYFVRKLIAARNAESAEAKAIALINEAKTQHKELLIQAKDKALVIIEKAKQEEQETKKDLHSQQQRLEKREEVFDKKILDLENKQETIFKKTEQLRKEEESIKEIKGQQMEKLQKIAGLTQDEAKDVLLKNTERQIKDDLVQRVRKLENISQEEWDNKARQILTQTVERCASSVTPELTTTTVSLPSDELKGRIIGREGRNIKTLEQLTGTEIIVDDTPETVVISGFSPIRRHLAKRVLEKLILDGRIHPGRIEEIVKKTKEEMAREIRKAGEDAVYEMGVTGLDPKLIQLLGRLKFRSSYGQNVLQHSIEVANLSALLAAELGADVTIAKKSGLLHDIGKAVDHEVIGTHPDIGRDLGKKFGLSEEIINGIAYHHEDHPPTLESVIVKVADAISGARVGARKDTYEEYIKRLEELENLARDFDGVDKTYAIQAGREIRVFVMPEEIDDLQAQKLAREIANRIEEELKYPGEIKVSVIREKRITEYAR